MAQNPATLATLKSGNHGPWLVLLHGFTLSQQMWSAQLHEFKATHRILAIDLPGHGSSSLLPSDQSFAAAVARTAATIHTHTAGEPYYLCGLSLGGYFAASIARTASHNIRRLIMVNSELRADSPEGRARRVTAIDLIDQGHSTRLINEILPFLFSPKASSQLQHDIATAMHQTDPKTLRAGMQWMMDRPNSSHLMTSLLHPPILIRGQDDQMYSYEDFATDYSSNPYVDFYQIPNAGHLACLEQPKMFNTILRLITP